MRNGSCSFHIYCATSILLTIDGKVKRTFCVLFTRFNKNPACVNKAHLSGQGRMLVSKGRELEPA